MPDFVDLLIQPSVATASLEPSLGPEVIPFVPAQSLGASPPHDEVYELDDIDLQALEPGQPPVLGELEAPHYTEVLDQLWMEFDDPEERTAGRMLALVEQVAAESMRLHQLQLEFWDSLAAKTIPESEFDRFQSEYLAYLKRLKGYKQTLLVLPETSRDTDEIYLGLIKRRSGAGPVPDAIMHLYFSNQIGILEQHAEDMSEGFVGRVMTALAVVDRVAEDAAEALSDEVRDTAEDAQSAWKRAYWWIVGGVTVVVSGAVGTAVLLTREGNRER